MASVLPFSQFRTRRPRAFAVLLLIVLATAASANQKERLAAKFIPGEILRYQIESHTATTVKVTTPIADPEGGSRSSQTLDLLVRLEVLAPAPPAAPGATRFRVTYEKCHAESDSDAFDPTGPSFEDQYTHIEGRSFEFTLDAGGRITDLTGLDAIFPNRAAAAAGFSWLDSLFPALLFPRDGVSIGQKWKSEHPVTGMPLADLVWLSDSTYLRDESCAASAGSASDATAEPSASSPSAAEPSTCATILTRYRMSRRGSPHSEATPPDYRENGLRTSGDWGGSGDNLDSVSLSTGLLLSSTQNSTQDIDYTIASAATGASIRRKGRVQNQLIVTLIPDSH
ncbi:MAG TPA: hypothetical protein VMB02_15605 [Candidatus Aquilonibacter sp.]|nr:hypothetical protein [Candidatus Aquilonibacter sp.]